MYLIVEFFFFTIFKLLPGHLPHPKHLVPTITLSLLWDPNPRTSATVFPQSALETALTRQPQHHRANGIHTPFSVWDPLIQAVNVTRSMVDSASVWALPLSANVIHSASS